MALDPIKNFAKVTVSTGYDSAATSITLNSGDGNKLPDPATDGAFNLVWWNATDYPDPSDDPNVEIVRVTAKSGDTLTITRGQEGTSAADHNTSGKTYKMVLAITEKTMSDINSTFLWLDQTSPQSIVNGSPLLQNTPTGTSDIKSIVNKEYVDNAVTALGASYYLHDDDDATGYKICYLEPSSSAETYIEATNLSNDDYIGGWISAPGEEPSVLLRGIYNWYVFAEKPTGTQTLRLYWKLYERKSDNSEVLIATSSNSNEVTTSKSSFIIPLELDSDYIPDSGSRIVGKMYANVSGTGSVPSVKIYYQGEGGSRWEIPANSEVWRNVFVPYEGATQNVDLGSYGLTTNSLTIGSLDGVLKASSGVVSGGAELNDLADTLITTPSSGQYLRYDGSNWVNSSIQAADLPSHTHTKSDITDTPWAWSDVDKTGSSINDLGDVSISSPAAGQYLRYDGSNWVNASIQLADLPTINLDDLGDVSITTPADGEVLTYNSSTGKWENKAAGGGGTDLFDSGKFALSMFFQSSNPFNTGTGGSGSYQIADYGLQVTTGTSSNSYSYASLGSLWGEHGYSKSAKIRIWLNSLTLSDNGTAYIYAFINQIRPSEATYYVGIRVEMSGGTRTAYFVTKDGSTEEATDITSSFGASGYNLEQVIDFEFNPGANAKVYINGSLVATHSTHIPPSSAWGVDIRPVGFEVKNGTDTANTSMRVVGVNMEREL